MSGSKSQAGKTPQPNAYANETLSQRIQRLRESLNLSQQQFAQKAHLTETFVQDLESGLESFLAPAVRQKIARALRVKIATIQEVERLPQQPPTIVIDAEKREEMVKNILFRPERSLFCPSCGGKLVIRTFDRKDLQDTIITLIKAHCSKCLFSMEHEHYPLI